MKSDLRYFIETVMYFVVVFSLAFCLLEHMEEKGIDVDKRSCECCINHKGDI